MLLSKGRIELDRDPYDWLRDLQAAEQVVLAAPSPEASMQAGLLPSRGFRGDPADAILYCQAREHGWTLISKDSRIRDFARETREVKTLW